MEDSVNTLTQQANLLASDMVGVFSMLYFVLMLFIFVSFLNIYTLDKYEFQNNLQSCYEFKKRIPFLLTYSKNKSIVAKKTFILEMIGYGVGIFTLLSYAISLGLIVDTAFVLLAVSAVLIVAFSVSVAVLYRMGMKK